VFALQPSHLEELLIYMAVFQGAAVLNLGGSFTFGLSPYFFTACLLAARLAVKWTSGRVRFRKDEFCQNHLQLAALFVAWCVISAFLLPILFEGAPVDSPRAGAEAVFYLALPLKWSFSNAGQAGYMLLNFFVLLAFADFCDARTPKALMDAFTCSGIIVILVGFYQMMANSFSLPFPVSFFNSNDTWAQNYNQMIGAGWHRVSATFVEPSEAGGFLSSWVLFELILANWGSIKRTRHWSFAALGLVVLLATTSSTGYITLVLVLAFVCGRLVLGVLGGGRISIRAARIALAVALLGVGFVTIGHDRSLLDSVLWHKASSSSAFYRFATVQRAVGVMQETYGLGAGLGSNRAFGALAYIGSNLGVFGLVVFAYMLTQLCVETRRYLGLRSIRMVDKAGVLACFVAFSANLFGEAISGAEISDPRIWVLWGMLLASLRAQAWVSHSQPEVA
jgi:hypothetical protein